MRKTRDGQAKFDVPDGATYGDYPITEIGYDDKMGRVWVVYNGDDFFGEWEQLIFSAELEEETVKVTNTPPGLVPPERLPKDGDTPGGKESSKLYDLLEQVGIEVTNYD